MSTAVNCHVFFHFSLKAYQDCVCCSAILKRPSSILVPTRRLYFGSVGTASPEYVFKPYLEGMFIPDSCFRDYRVTRSVGFMYNILSSRAMLGTPA